MTNDGGRADEPTSYGLQPPQAPVTAAPAPPVPAQGVPYQPTRAAARPGGPDPRAGQPVHAADPDAGRLIGGRYRLVSRLGHGGMGTVWKAHDQVVDREVAVKEPRVPENVPERERQTVYQRMEREARAAARIDHPSVVTVHDVVVEDGRPWIVMELVRGHSLGDQLTEGTLDPREAARVGLAVLGALAAAHVAGVLHRDVKPDNVLIGRNDRVVLTDFGIAQVEGEQGLTETGAFVGSPEYIAPERVLGQRPGPESDLWSLGVVLYAAVEGMSPFRRSHTPATLQAILSAEPQTPTRASGPLGTLIMQLLRKEPSARPSVAEARQTLEAVARPPQPTPTVLAARPDAGGGNRFVPPVLHGNRKAQFGFGGAVVAVAVVLVLILANPFASGGALPDGWTVREEPEVVQSSLGVPKEYTRVVDDDTSDDRSVTFRDPSGFYTISLRQVLPGGGNDGLGGGEYRHTPKDAADAAKQAADYYRAGANSSMSEAEPARSEAARQQGKDAVDLATEYRDYGADEDDLTYRTMERFCVNGKHVLWQLTVTMPAAGKGRDGGEELFRDVVAHWEIQSDKL